MKMNIDLEELKNNEQFVEFLNEQIEKAKEPVLRKNEELLASIKTMKNKLKKYPEEDEFLELQEKAQLADQYEREQLESKGQYDEIISKTKKQYEDKIKEMKESLEAKDQLIKKHVIESKLAEALAEVKCKPSMLKAAVRLLTDDIQVVENGDQIETMVGALSISEHIKQWSQTPEGKEFVLAPENTGGGVSGGVNGQSSGDVSGVDKYFNPSSPEYNITKQFELMKSDPEQYNQLKQRYPTKPSMPRIFGGQ